MSAFPFDPDYDFGDCHHVVILPPPFLLPCAALSPDASQEHITETSCRAQHPATGAAGKDQEQP